MIPSPFVKRINSPLNPSNHLVGISNSIVVNPFSDFIDCIIPLRLDMFSIIVPVNPSSTLTINCSIGSSFLPPSSLKITCGGPTCSSRPSLRMVSIRTERCNSHLPDTTNLPSSLSTLNQTLVSSSLANLSSRFLVVIYFHSFPAKGESLTRNSIRRVGSSIDILGNGSISPVHTVSPTNIVGIPAIVIISPHDACGDSILWSPRVVYILAIFPVLLVQSFANIVTVCPTFAVPSYTRPIHNLPTYSSYARFAICIRNGLSE